MAAVAFSELLTAARQIVDERKAGTDAFCTDTEGYRYVNRAVESLRSELVLARGHEFLATSRTFSTVAGTSAYTLPVGPSPAAHYETLSVALVWSATDVEDVPAFEWAERADGMALSWGAHLPKGYRLIGTSLVFVPTPTSVVTVMHDYVPEYSEGTSTTTFDGMVDGWRDVVEMDVAARILFMRGERLESEAMRSLRNDALEKVQRLAQDRAAREPIRVSDVNPEGAYMGRRRWWPRVSA